MCELMSLLKNNLILENIFCTVLFHKSTHVIQPISLKNHYYKLIYINI